MTTLVKTLTIIFFISTFIVSIGLYSQNYIIRNNSTIEVVTELYAISNTSTADSFNIEGVWNDIYDPSDTKNNLAILEVNPSLPTSTDIAPLIKNFYSFGSEGVKNTLFSGAYSYKKFLTEASPIRLQYDHQNQILIFSIPGGELSAGEVRYSYNSKILASIPVSKTSEVIRIGDIYLDGESNFETDIPLHVLRGAKVFTFGKTQNSQSFKNLLKGFTQTQLSDCSSSLPGLPDMSLEPYRGVQLDHASILLSSRNHFACISKTVPFIVNSKSLYSISVDTKSILGNTARLQYSVYSGNKKMTEFSKSFPIQDTWSTYKTYIELPLRTTQDEDNEVSHIESRLFPYAVTEQYEGDVTVNMYLYAPSDGSEEISTAYSNFKLDEFELIDTLDIPFLLTENKNYTLIENLPLSADTLITVEHSKQNLLGEKSSFNDGPWQDPADNCSVDMSGEPDISVQKFLNDGQSEINLISNNHFGCVYRTFPVNLSHSKQYRLLLDYKTADSNMRARYYFVVNGDNKKEHFDATLAGTNNSWTSTTHTFNLDHNDSASSISIYLYAPSDGTPQNISYRNIRLEEWIPVDSSAYFLQLGTDYNVNEHYISSVKQLGREFQISISDTSKPFLVSTDLKNPEWWELSAAKQSGHKFTRYRLLDGKTAWLINPSLICNSDTSSCVENSNHDYTIRLSFHFKIQRWFYLGLLVSGTTLVSIIGYLVYDMIRRRRNKVLIIDSKSETV